MISKSHVLTTAWCTTLGESKIKVLIGDGSKVAVSTITDDPLYNINTDQNDFSILTLAQAVTFSDKVSPACLPSDGTQDYAGQEATVIGWGITEDGSRPSVLQEANVTVITNKECQSDWSAYPGHVSEYA